MMDNRDVRKYQSEQQSYAQKELLIVISNIIKNIK